MEANKFYQTVAVYNHIETIPKEYFILELYCRIQKNETIDGIKDYQYTFIFICFVFKTS